MAELPIPSWFKYLQGTAEPAGDNCYRLKAPLVDETFIRVQSENGKWSASVADAADGPALRKTDAFFATAMEAWIAAFELYRAEKIY
jgi:hypothetical protein